MPPRLRLVPDPPSRNPNLKGTPEGLLGTMDAYHEDTQTLVTETMALLNEHAPVKNDETDPPSLPRPK